jgi:hypothetical protein
MSMIRKFFALSSVAAAVALTACGGGDDPVQTAADTPAVAVSPTNVAAAKAAAAGLVVAPAVTLPALTSKEGVVLAAGTTLKFTAAPAGASASTISGFTMTNGTASASGVLEAGSCKFTVTTSTNPALPVGTVVTFDPCNIDFNTAGVPTNGTTANITAALNFGGTTVSVPAIPVSVTVVNGVAQISACGTVVVTGSVATGS